MRKFVEPPPSILCDRCGSQLTLKRVESATAGLERSSQVFACVNCGNERSVTTPQDHYAARLDSARRFSYG